MILSGEAVFSSVFYYYNNRKNVVFKWGRDIIYMYYHALLIGSYTSQLITSQHSGITTLFLLNERIYSLQV